MSLTDPFVRRPIMTTLVMVSILGAGLLAFFRLPVSDLPNVDFPTINVSASLPGAEPETMASSVATPLGKGVFHDSGHRVDDIDELAGRHKHHDPV